MFPFSQWILILIVVLLVSIGTHVENVGNTNRYYVRNNFTSPSLIICGLVLIYFSSHTIANDVWAYRLSYTYDNFGLSFVELLNNGTGSNPLFQYFQGFSKNTLNLDASGFQLLCAIIIQPLFLLFYRRYSPSLPLSLFMFIASGLFYFTVVSWKQSIAMSFGLTLIPLATKKKWKEYYIGLLVIMLIHPYIMMYGILPFLINDKVWTKKNILMLFLMFIAGYAMSSILGLALDVTEEVFGDRHDAQYFDSEHGISLPRVIFFSITPILSWIYRKRLDENPNPIINGFIQMSVVSFGFYLMSLFGGANFISRMGTYFEPFTYVALPYILLHTIPQNKRTLYSTIVFLMFLVFFSFLQLKRCSLF